MTVGFLKMVTIRFFSSWFSLKQRGKAVALSSSSDVEFFFLEFCFLVVLSLRRFVCEISLWKRNYPRCRANSL